MAQRQLLNLILRQDTAYLALEVQPFVTSPKIIHKQEATGEEIISQPLHLGRRGGPTWERDGYVPHVRAIFDEHDRMMVAIHWNTDLGDAWEWADDPYYPLKYSNYAWQVAINFIVYAMTH